MTLYFDIAQFLLQNEKSKNAGMMRI